MYLIYLQCAVKSRIVFTITLSQKKYLKKKTIGLMLYLLLEYHSSSNSKSTLAYKSENEISKSPEANFKTASPP